MKPKHHMSVCFGAKGAKVDVGCVTLYYGEGQENEMIRDFERYLSEPEEMEKLYSKSVMVSPESPTVSPDRPKMARARPSRAEPEQQEQLDSMRTERS